MDENDKSPDEVLDGVIHVHRADQAYAMKMSGMSLSRICEELGYSSAGAVGRALRERFDQQARVITSLERESILALELDRLDALQAGSWESAVYGDPRSVDSVLKIMTLRMKLLKLDQPDADTSQQTVLVVGDTENSYVEKLKLIIESPEKEPSDGES